MLDRIEPPTIPDGYSMSLAFLCLLDVVGCVRYIVGGEGEPLNNDATPEQIQSNMKMKSKHQQG